MIRVYGDAGNVIQTHEHKGDFKEWGRASETISWRGPLPTNFQATRPVPHRQSKTHDKCGLHVILAIAALRTGPRRGGVAGTKAATGWKRLCFALEFVASNFPQRRRGGIGRRAGLKIQKSPILSGYFSLNADRVFHR